MFGFGKISQVAIEMNDYIIRMLIKKGDGFKSHEVRLPEGLVKEGVIIDEMALFQIMKKQIAKIGGKKHVVRTFAPDAYVLLKAFEYPEKIKDSELKEYVQMELGRSIHLPFDDPIIDVYDPVVGDNEAIVFAAQSEEVNKLINLMIDTNLDPEAVDVRLLCNIRLLHEMNRLKQDQTYIITNWSINELSICIYTNNEVEFLRYQPIDTDLTKWTANNSSDDLQFTYSGNEEEYRYLLLDRAVELERIMNFFRFSLHKGEKTIDEVVIMGDHPSLSYISELIESQLSLPTQTINDAAIQANYPYLQAKHAALLGLSLKEVQ